MTIKLSKYGNNTVLFHLQYLNNLAQSNSIDSQHAKEDLKRIWLNIERLKQIPPQTLFNENILKEFELQNIKHVSSNLFSLTVGLDSYVFAVENDIYVFLIVCKRGLENNEFVITAANMCFDCWLQQKSLL